MNEIIFNATIKWLEDKEIEDVLMATYDTEGKPEDEIVLYSFGGYELDEIMEMLENNTHGGDFEVIAYDKHTLSR